MYDNPHDIVKSLLRTEKGTYALINNQYFFWVDKKANKISIKKAVEDIYKVNVVAVNTLNVRGKFKRVRLVPGYSASWKKAVVTLKQGDKIDMATT